MTHDLKPAFDQADAQNRISELKRQMRPLLSSPVRDDRIMLDYLSGDFFLRSDVEKNGMDNANALGRINVKTEYDAFKIAATDVLGRKIERALNQLQPTQA